LRLGKAREPGFEHVAQALSRLQQVP